jgi:hypothetical protein
MIFAVINNSLDNEVNKRFRFGKLVENILLAYSNALTHYHEKGIPLQVISITILLSIDIYQIYHQIGHLGGCFSALPVMILTPRD